MAATDRTYRSQRALDIFFGVSCVLMLAAIVWMFAQDYYRPYKVEARDFRDVEEALYDRQALDLVPDDAKLADIQAAEEELKSARAERDKEAAELDRQLKEKLAAKVRADARAQGIKADFDSKMSLYNIDVERRNAATPGTREAGALASQADRRRQEVEDLGRQLGAAQTDADAKTREYDDVRARKKAAEDRVSKAEDRLKVLTGDFDRFAKLAAQKRWKAGDVFRKLPVIDAFASPTRIQQTTLTELPIDYNFKQVTRFDRCTTCHLGIDRPAFTKSAIRSLTEEPSKDLQAKLDNARQMLEKRRQTLGKQKNDPDPGSLRLAVLRKDELIDPGRGINRVNEFCAHPRLDLFVDGNSPHPAEKFGCTICHQGQGSATEFTLAAHTPNTAREKEDWEVHKEWGASHFWDFPMLPRRFLEASCIKCHHQVVDLLPRGNQVETREGEQSDTPGAKVVRGYNLVRELGCFGCHEISGTKGGRAVGPDLRLEPPLDDLNPDGSPKGPIDPQNPPGTMRRVGPDLHRLAEKTNEEWARSWIRGPRQFRPDTKMPHFYGLANNNPEALKGTGQEDFPDTEIYAITYYLFKESRDYLSRPGVPKLADAPAENKDLNEGRRLFTERGCLACHQHAATAEEGARNPLPKVVSQATFGPNLSRLAAKLGTRPGDKASARKWLTQWIFDPRFHHPRSFMPVTHLTRDEASKVADWLLSQPANWEEIKPPALKPEALTELARVYLEKAMTPQEAKELLDNKGYTSEQAHNLKEVRPDADELKLAQDAGGNWTEKLQWYVGRKSISQLGCFGCHNIPGFENAKPIGTPLNDWGKKDPERLAFEDVIAWVNRYTQRVEEPGAAKDVHGEAVQFDKGATADPAEAQRDPLKRAQRSMEEFFYEALDHHQRDGFLNQKLREPRSFDYERVRRWDERLRMPQFQFARGDVEPRVGETEEQANLRKAREESEAREAAMTFILGLVADQVPLSYLAQPTGDKLAEVRGKHVLDKFNCAGCHQLRPGSYEYNLAKPSTVLNELEEAYKNVAESSSFRSDYHFRDHNAWVGKEPAKGGNLVAYGLPRGESAEQIRLTQALRFVKRPEDVRNPSDADELPPGAYDIPAAEILALSAKDRVIRGDPQGGVFADLMMPYLMQRKLPDLEEAGKARAGLPPPLLREGERVQPTWLYQFLRNPYKIREVTMGGLRMPRFNMSDDDAMALVNYFAAVDRMSNPASHLHYPYLAIPEREESYLKSEEEGYAQRLKQDGLAGRAFVPDALRLLTNKELCLNCHQVGSQVKDKPNAPSLNLTPDRMRPEWTRYWIANPARIIVYPEATHPMPQNFPANELRYLDMFDGEALAAMPAGLQAVVRGPEQKLKAAIAAGARETDPKKQKAQDEARSKIEQELKDAVQKYLRDADAKVRSAREEEAGEADPKARAEKEKARKKAEEDLSAARRAVARFPLNQVGAVRDVLMNFNRIVPTETMSSRTNGGGTK